MLIAAKLKRQAALRATTALLAKIGMKNVRIEIVDTLSSNRPGDAVEALYDPNVVKAGQAIIKIADDVWSPDMKLDDFVQQITGVAAHELLHHMKRAKAFSASEWKTLVKHARNTESKMRGTKLGMTWMERAAVIERDPKLTKAQQAAQIERIEEEAVAESLRDFVLNGPVTPPQARGLFRRILGWVRGLFAYKAAAANQIFEGITSGKYNDISYNLQASGPQTPYSRVQVQNFRRKGGTGVFEDMQRQTDGANFRQGRGAVQRGLVLGETPQETRDRLAAEAQKRIAEEEAAKARSAQFEGRRMLPSLQPTRFSRVLTDIGDKKKASEYYGLRRFSGTLPDSIGVGPLEYNTPILNSILDTKVEVARPDDWIKAIKAWAGVSDARAEELDDSGLIDMLTEEASSGTAEITQNDILNVLDAGQEKAEVLFSRVPGLPPLGDLLNMRRSAVEDEIGSANIKAQSKEQWVNLLNAWVQKGKIKKEELEDRGVTDWLEDAFEVGQIVQKKDIEEFLSFSREQSVFSVGVPEVFKLRSAELPRQATKYYEQYSIPGGEEYAVITFEGGKNIPTFAGHFNEDGRTQSFVRLKIRDISVPVGDKAGGEYARKKVVEIVEVQSDLHQKGRKQGYGENRPVDPRYQFAQPARNLMQRGLVGEVATYGLLSSADNRNYGNLPAFKRRSITGAAVLSRYRYSDLANMLTELTNLEDVENPNLTQELEVVEWAEEHTRIGSVASNGKRLIKRFGENLDGNSVVNYKKEIAGVDIQKHKARERLLSLKDSDDVFQGMMQYDFEANEILSKKIENIINSVEPRDHKKYQSLEEIGASYIILDLFKKARGWAKFAENFRENLVKKLGNQTVRLFEAHNFMDVPVTRNASVSWETGRPATPGPGEDFGDHYNHMYERLHYVRPNLLFGVGAEFLNPSKKTPFLSPVPNRASPEVTSFIKDLYARDKGKFEMYSTLLSFAGGDQKNSTPSDWLNGKIPLEDALHMVMYGETRDGKSVVVKSVLDNASKITGYRVTPGHFAMAKAYEKFLDDILEGYGRIVKGVSEIWELEFAYDSLPKLLDFGSTEQNWEQYENTMMERGAGEDEVQYLIRLNELASLHGEAMQRSVALPDSPYKTSWPRNMLLAAIKYGISKGADGVLMDPGSVFIDRYHSHKNDKRSAGYIKFYDGDLPKVLKSVVGREPSKVEPRFFVSSDLIPLTSRSAKLAGAAFKSGSLTSALPYGIVVSPTALNAALEAEVAANQNLLQGANFNINDYKVSTLHDSSPKFYYAELDEKTKAEVLGIRNTRYSRVAVDPALVRQIQNEFTHTAAVSSVKAGLSKTGMGANRTEYWQDQVDAAFQKFQDKMLPLGKIYDALKEQGIEIPEEYEAYIKFSLMRNRVKDRLRIIDESILTPLYEDIKNAIKFNENDIESLRAVAPNYAEFVEESKSTNKGMADAYAAAEHAVERNDVGAQRNIEGNDVADASASGFETAESIAAQNWFRAHREYAGMQKIHDQYMAVMAEINKLRDEYELSPDWKVIKPGREFAAAGHPDGFKKMVPLRGTGDEDTDIDPNNPLDRKESEAIKVGRGQRITGREDKAFLGRGSYVDPVTGQTKLNRPPPLILEHMNQMLMQAVIRGEKNRVGQAIGGFINTFGNMKVDYRGRNVDISSLFRVVHQAPMRRVLVDGVVKLLPDHNFKHDENMLIYKTRAPDGNVNEIVVEVFDKRLRDALTGGNGYGSEDAGLILSNIAKVTQFMAKVSTQWNPLFPLTNFPRDLASAAINLQQHQIPGLTGDVMKGVPSAARAIFKFQTHKGMAYLASGKEASREEHIVNGENWTDYLKRFQKEGGNFDVFDLTDIKDIHKQINEKIAPDPKDIQSVWSGVKRFGNFIESYNKVVENSIRLATFKAFADAGFSDQDAAYMSQNVTVNYGRGGIHKSTMTALWMFYNANIQGNMTILNAMARSKAVRGVVGAVIVSGIMQDLMMSLMAGDDEETGDNKYDQIPDWLLESRAVFIDPTGTTEDGFFSFPMPFGYSSAFNFGRAMSRYMRDRYTEGEAIGTIFGSLTQSFNPLGGSQSFWAFISPTITDPFVELTLNEDWSGRKIYKEANPFEVEIPLSQRTWGNPTWGAKAFTDTLHTITGGGPTTPGGFGWTEWSPNVIDYLFKYYLGGVGSVVGQTQSFITSTIPRMVAGEEWETREIPAVSKFFGNVGSSGNTDRFFQIMDEAKRVKKEIDLAKDTKDYDAIREALQSNREMYNFSKIADTLGNQRKAISSRIRQIQNNPQIPDDKKSEIVGPLTERMREIERRLIKQYNERIRDAEAE